MTRVFISSKIDSFPTLAARYMAAHSDHFDSGMAAARYLNLIFFPPSRRWRYQLNGKSGTTFVLNLLFEIEYGCRFTAQVDPAMTGNQHPDFAVFQLPHSGLLANAIEAGDSVEDIDTFAGLSLATVRNPWTRILSAFFYLCRSHEIGDKRFLAERIRLNALCRFDWDADRNTATGFAKFVDYIDIMTKELGVDSLDAHWLPQARHIRPDLYRPTILGRTENLRAFSDALQDALHVEKRVALDALRGNKQKGSKKDISNFFAQPRTKTTIRKLYEEDFDIFKYSSQPPFQLKSNS